MASRGPFVYLRGLALLGVVFAYGIAVGLYHVPPFATLKSVQDSLGVYWLELVGARYRRDQEVLQFAFTGKLIDGEQILPPIKSLEALFAADASMETPIDSYYDAYDAIQLGDVSLLDLDGGKTQVLKVAYELAGARFEAYAYKFPEETDQSVLIIPGSGSNQSSAIYARDAANYHFGILDAVDSSFSRYVLIKPNEDCIAFHNGTARLDPDFFVNWLLNRGASYSANYIVNSLAVTKYLRQRYRKVVVAGLSQGGAAALLNALQSKPDAAIVASGFSVLDERITWAGYDQIVIPGLHQRLDIDTVRDAIKRSPTRFLFTWGENERGPFRVDEHDHLTCDYLSGLRNVDCAVHKGGHVFPVDLIRRFLAASENAPQRHS